MTPDEDALLLLRVVQRHVGSLLGTLNTSDFAEEDWGFLAQQRVLMPFSFYISSPFRGLRQERDAAKRAVVENNHGYEASPDPVIETCLKDVAPRDVYRCPFTSARHPDPSTLGVNPPR